jgi:D-alanyl-D-alanine carboxypeptidase
MAADRQIILQALAELGISSDYGMDPYLPCFQETRVLVDVEPNFTGVMQRLAPAAASQWSGMKQAAQGDNVVLQLVSGFRSIDRQRQLIANKLAAGQSIETILRVNAAPGFSQHHSGMAMDVTTAGVAPLSEVFEETDAFHWLVEHAAAYDFYMPYCRSNRYSFCYEPWHWALKVLDET